MKQIIAFLFAFSLIGCDGGESDKSPTGTLCVGSNVESSYLLCRTITAKCEKRISPPQVAGELTNCFDVEVGSYTVTFSAPAGYSAGQTLPVDVIYGDSQSEVYEIFFRTAPP